MSSLLISSLGFTWFHMVKHPAFRSAFLCFSTRYHGTSLASMLRQTAAKGRMHLLVCESFTGEVFGALLRRRAERGELSAEEPSDGVPLRHPL